ncbi:GAF domain-containing protein [Mesorhizobium sp. RP14(2022)]|uniref:GAF domain-containing protein n=1 Tax=Mesorhizobium liriopis TaxID=2953882 RepID=A0ABT1C6T7_9HYPH|nr:histidine kinase dimerization/phosphoacceptor domain -containing protein [Mesorhizobium liriopis]MCO6050467.1 GAF domain-containing protein [Mesorhizobium liriopis]
MTAQISDATEATPDMQVALNACDREPIHVPGSIQPHGLLLVADASSLEVVAGAGDIETRLTPDWLGRSLPDLVGADVTAALAATDLGPGGGLSLGATNGLSERLDVTLHRSGTYLVAELEPATEKPISAAAMLARLDVWNGFFERSTDLQNLCERAATAFRDLTGFARVMIYRFLDDGAGEVVAEDRAEGQSAFLNHHFPASDIPRQARALYVRNRIRVIPDVSYLPQPIRPGEGFATIDLSDVGLRSVSPIHVQYLKNMEVNASASVSIVKDGVLWGLVACHHDQSRFIPFETRAAAQALAASLSRQIKAREDAEIYRERLRLRTGQDQILSELDADTTFDALFHSTGEDMRRLFGADGFALVRGPDIRQTERTPSATDIRRIVRWLTDRGMAETFSTYRLPTDFALAETFADRASGLLALRISGDEPEFYLWFRAEKIAVINWAGNPHKAVAHDRNAILTPRTSFENWSETVRGQSRPWTLVEIEAANRLRRALLDLRQNRQLRVLNRRLTTLVAEKEALLGEKDYLIKEVNHRVQNSLQLVSAFLGLQGRQANDPVVSNHLKEAQRRLSAVALVHRRLYRNDSVGAVDLSRYLEELVEDMKSTMGEEWAAQMRLDISPVLVSADRAVTVGLILTELVINASKYAYDGAAGPIAISLDQYRNQFRLVVADQGKGSTRLEKMELDESRSAGRGFGTQMIRAMVDRLSGTIDYGSNDPGMRVVVMAPTESADGLSAADNEV